MKNHYSIHTFELRKYCKYKEFNQYLDMFKAEAKGNYKVYMNEKETVICRFEGKGIRMIMKPKKKKPYISFIINPQEVLHNGDLIHLIKHDKLCKALHAVDVMLHDLNKGEFSVNSLDLCRIDFSANIKVPKEDIPHYIALFRKTRSKKGYKIKGQRKSYIARENGFTAENKQAGKAIAIYNKEAQLEQIGKHKQAKRASGIMRVEFQLLKQSTIKDYASGKTNNLRIMSCAENSEAKIQEMLVHHFMDADYYKGKEAFKLINASHYKNNRKEKMQCLIHQTAIKHGVFNGKQKMQDTYKMADSTVIDILNALQAINVNAVTLKKNGKVKYLSSFFRYL